MSRTCGMAPRRSGRPNMTIAILYTTAMSMTLSIRQARRSSFLESDDKQIILLRKPSESVVDARQSAQHCKYPGRSF